MSHSSPLDTPTPLQRRLCQAMGEGDGDAIWRIYQRLSQALSDRENDFVASTLTRLSLAAAHFGSLPAQRQLAQHYAQSERKEDRLRAIHWRVKAAKAGDPQASCLLAEHILRGDIANAPVDSARTLLEYATRQGHLHAMYLLGNLYREGVAVERNREVAKRLFHRAARRGHSESQLAYAQILCAEQAHDEAKVWLYLAMRNGVLAAQWRLASLFELSPQPCDQQSALRLYQEAAAKGCPEATFRLALLQKQQTKTRPPKPLKLLLKKAHIRFRTYEQPQPA